MNTNNTVILLAINLTDDNNFIGLTRLLSKLEYSDEEGIGFKNISQVSDKIIVGEALKKTPIFLNVLNANTQLVEKKEEFILSEIDFTIDLENKILEVYSNQQELKKLLLVFRRLAKDIIALRQLNFSISSLLLALKDITEILEVKRMLVRDFQHIEGVVGSYDMNFYNSDLAWGFLEKYPSQVYRITFYIAKDDWEGIAILETSGKMKFSSKSKSAMIKFLDLIKSLISNPN